MSKKTKILLQLLGPVIFVYILFQIDYQLFLAQLKLIQWPFLILSFLIMSSEIIIRSLRWRIILNSLQINLSVFRSITLYWLGTFIGVITPGRLGELIKIYFLKNKGHSPFRSFFSVIIDRLVDVFVLLFFGFLIFFFFLKEIGIYMLILSGLVLLILIIIFLLIDSRSFLHKFFARFLSKIFPIDFKKYSSFTFPKFWQGIRELKGKNILLFLSYLVIGWLFYFSARYFIALSLGIDLSFLEISVISILVAIVTVLPISIAGLGTREVAVIYLFSIFGLNKETALVFSLLIFTIDLLVISFGLIPYFKESRLIGKVKID